MLSWMPVYLILQKPFEWLALPLFSQVRKHVQRLRYLFSQVEEMDLDPTVGPAL